MTAKVALAVPCFNERWRLDVARFAEGAERNNLQILFVDDGSADGTADFIAEKITDYPRLGLLRCEQNQGKGDTLCGAKLFRREIVPAVFGEEFVSRWIFDVELYQRLGRDRILECPVLSWTDQPGSKISVFREFPQVFRDLLRIRAQRLKR